MLLECRPLSTFSLDDLARVREAFKETTPVPLRQAWLETPEPDFAPGVVRTGWHDDTLLVFAELADTDVFTRASRQDDRFWELGDTFEIFLQPEGDDRYLELHVAPNNLRLQLRFDKPPSPQDVDPFSAALIHTDIFDSRTWTATAGSWCVFASVPLGALFGRPLAGSTWRFSFGRYDAARARVHPVISSSSSHTAPAFHRPDEWGSVHFAS